MLPSAGEEIIDILGDGAPAEDMVGVGSVVLLYLYLKTIYFKTDARPWCSGGSLANGAGNPELVPIPSAGLLSESGLHSSV